MTEVVLFLPFVRLVSISYSFSPLPRPISLSISVSFYVSFDSLCIYGLCVYVATGDERETYKTNDKPYRCFSFEHFARRTSRTKTKIQIETSRITEINRLLYTHRAIRTYIINGYICSVCREHKTVWRPQRKNYHTAASFVAYRNANAIRLMRVYACVWMFWQKKK